MEEYEKLKRHLGKKVEIEISNGDVTDKFHLKPLSFKQYAQVVTLNKYMDFDNPENIDPEMFSEMYKVLVDIMKRSYPDINDQTIEQFVEDNSLELMENLEKLMPKSNKKANPTQIQEMKEALKHIKSTKNKEKSNNKDNNNLKEKNVKQEGDSGNKEQSTNREQRSEETG